MTIVVRDPVIVRNLLPEALFKMYQKKVIDEYERQAQNKNNLAEEFHRYNINEEGNPWLRELHEQLTPSAHVLFKDVTIKPAWLQVGVYEGAGSKLHKHKDTNACQFSIDYCFWNKTQPWPIWIEGKEYVLQENEAVVMYGNHQEHWREKFPDPDNNVVANGFFFWCEPDHWFFTKGGKAYVEQGQKEWNDKLIAEGYKEDRNYGM